MNFKAYEQLFIDILADAQDEELAAPYNSPDYLNYLKLNMARQQRWLKIGVLSDELSAVIKNIAYNQVWTVITEPWCGDSAHTIPFIQRLSELNPLIKVDYQLRDTPPFLIEKYLTNGSKSIPKLIIQDDAGKKTTVWGPRPAECQVLNDQLERDHVELHAKKIALQQWYNADKGGSFQRELLNMITKAKMKMPG
jgi:hypothetical protein